MMMKLRNVTGIFGAMALTAAMGCSEATDTNAPVEISNADLDGALASKADAQDIRVLGDGRIVFYGDIAQELLTLGNVSPRTQAQREGGLTYTQSPFAYCVNNSSEAACITYIPGAEVKGDTLSFGGRVNSTVDAEKAYDIILTMYYGEYDRHVENNMLELSQAGSPISCTYGNRQANCSITTADQATTQTTVTVSFDQLPKLGADYVYEGWLIVDGAPVTAGRFDAAEEVEFKFDADYTEATAYILTIEPRFNDDPAPSSTHILGGDLVGGDADITIAHPGALGNDFTRVTGSFLLATPSSETPELDFLKGIWFVDPTSGSPMPSLNLPTLPAGWAYEGWVATENGPISTGRFTSLEGADSDGAGPAAGPNAGPPFPGQDFIKPALELPGNMAVISIEPEPDDSPAPFALKPLVGMIESADMPGVLQQLNHNGEAVPTGRVAVR